MRQACESPRRSVFPALYLFIALSLVVTVPRGAAQHEMDALGLRNVLTKAIETRNACQTRVRSVSCSFRSETTPAPESIALHSRENNVSLEGARRKLSFRYDCRYSETSTGLFRLRFTRLDDAGGPIIERVLFFDGKRSWQLTTEVGDAAREKVHAKVGDDLICEFASLALPRDLMDGALPRPVARPLVSRVIGGEGASATGVEQIEGCACLVVSWVGPREGHEGKEIYHGPISRFTVWLDTDHQFVPRRVRIEDLDNGHMPWFTSTVWTVQGLGRTSLRGAQGPEDLYWYPKKATLTTYYSTSQECTRTRVYVSELEINAPVEQSAFRPTTLEESKFPGSGSSGHGAEAAVDPISPARPGVLTWFGMWFRFGLGTVALILAFLLLGRRKAPRT